MVIGLGYREPRRRRRIEHRHGRALAHGHGFSRMTHVVRERDRNVAHRHLPGPHHLIAADQAADGAVADRDQECFVGHRWEAQHSICRLAQVDALQIESVRLRRDAAHIARHARRLAEQHLERHVDGSVLKHASP